MSVDWTGSLTTALTDSCAPSPSKKKTTSVSDKKMTCRSKLLSSSPPPNCVLGKKLLRSLAAVRFQAGNKNEAIHGGEPPFL
jgi:hypothetical protein